MSIESSSDDAANAPGSPPVVNEAKVNAMRSMFRVSAARDDAMKRWLSRHPGGIDSSKMEIPTAPLLSDILWRELQEQERIFLPDISVDPPGDEIQYWMRRRRITQFHRWMRVVSQLHPCWQRVANASGDEIRKAASAIGFTVISTASRRRSPAELVRWLAPLGQELATKVVIDAAEKATQTVERPVLVAWRAAYDGAAMFFRGPDLMERTGFILLSALFQKLSQAHRLALGRAARSTVFESLSQLTRIEMLEPAIRASEDAVSKAFSAQPQDPGSTRGTALESVELNVQQQS